MDKHKLSAGRAFAIAVSGLGLGSAAVVAQPADTSTRPRVIEEVVVTAQKRSENLKDVPVTVTLVNAAQMEQKNITTITELSRAAPAISNNGGIRGVATGGFTRSSEQAVSVVLDGVPLGRSKIENLFDIERVEVLSGPQGMLFGKNASAGVINIVTAAPNPEAFEIIGSVEVGNFDREQQRLTVNAPLGDDSALRVSLHNRGQTQGLENIFTGDELENSSYGTRARFLWEPSDRLAINVIGDLEKSRGSGETAFVFAKVESQELKDKLAACGVVASEDNTKTCADGISSKTADNQNWGLSTQIDYTLENDLVLSSITAKRRLTYGDTNYNGVGGDTDILPEDILNRNLPSGYEEIYSQEFRVTSPAGEKVDYVAGLYYYDSNSYSRTLQAGRLGNGLVLDLLYYPGAIAARGYDIDIDQTSVALFGQSTIRLDDQWSLIVGGRYTEESSRVQSLRFSQEKLQNLGFVFLPGFSDTFPNLVENVDTENFSWRLGAQYDWTDDVMAFFSVAKGYKGPAVNDLAVVADDSLVIIDEEIPTNYELGIRANILDRRAFASATLFYTKVEDFQTTVYVPASPSNPVPGFANGNAPYITTQGLNLEMFGRATDNLSFNVGVIYTDAEFSPGYVVACSTYQTTTGTCPASGTTEANDNLPNVSDWRVLLGAEYVKPVGALEVFVQSDITYESGYSMSSAYDPNLEMQDRTFLGARVGVRANDDAWGFSVWGRNLLDNFYPTMSPDPLGSFNGGGGTSYLSSRNANLYRTYGATLDFRF